MDNTRIIKKVLYLFVTAVFAGFIFARYKENRIKAQMAADKIAMSVIFIAVLFLGQGKLMGNLEYTLIAFVIVVALSIALKMFLGMYLLYHYDNDGSDGLFDESGE